MPTYTHEFSVSNSDQKEVFFNPSSVLPSSSSSSSPGHSQYHHPKHQVHFESLPFQYPPSSSLVEQEHEYSGHASTPNVDFSQYNWSPSVNDFGSSSSAFNLPANFGQSTHSYSGAESAQSPIGPVFRPPRKNAPKPFHSGKKGSHGAPRAGPRRPPRQNQGESFLRGPSSSPKMAGHQHHTNRQHALVGSASNNHNNNNNYRPNKNHKGVVPQNRPRPAMATAAATENLETVMLPPFAPKEHEKREE